MKGHVYKPLAVIRHKETKQVIPLFVHLRKQKCYLSIAVDFLATRVAWQKAKKNEKLSINEDKVWRQGNFCRHLFSSAQEHVGKTVALGLLSAKMTCLWVLMRRVKFV